MEMVERAGRRWGAFGSRAPTAQRTENRSTSSFCFDPFHYRYHTHQFALKAQSDQSMVKSDQLVPDEGLGMMSQWEQVRRPEFRLVLNYDLFSSRRLGSEPEGHQK